MMFWLKNFRMRGMQLAKTRCWAMYSNYETKSDISVRRNTWAPSVRVKESKDSMKGWLLHLWTRPGRCGLVWSASEAAAGWQRWPSRWSPCVDWRRRRVSCFAAPWSCNQNPSDVEKWFLIRTQQHTGDKLALGDTYGISSGSTSARMLIESVLALEVGAAASRIFSRAIWRFQKREKVSDQTHRNCCLIPKEWRLSCLMFQTLSQNPNTNILN